VKVPWAEKNVKAHPMSQAAATKPQEDDIGAASEGRLTNSAPIRGRETMRLARHLVLLIYNRAPLSTVVTHSHDLKQS
jgi:hypothetical protein